MTSKFYIPVFLLFIFLTPGCKKNNEVSQPGIIYFTGYDPGIGRPGVNWSEIYSINTADGDLNKLTNFSDNGTRNVQSLNVNFNADSSRLVFTSNKNPVFPNFDIYSIRIDGSNLEQHTNSAGIQSKYFNPTGYQISDNVEQILFDDNYSNGSSQYSEIKSVHTDGFTFTVHTQYPVDGSCYEPSMSIARREMIYISNKLDEKNIYSTTLSSILSPRLQLTFDGMTKHDPKFSPDGNRIAFSIYSDTGTIKFSEIWIMDNDGSNKRQITNYSNSGMLPIITNHPVFSRTGTEIFYLSNETGISQIYQMNIDGTNKRQITFSNLIKQNILVK